MAARRFRMTGAARTCDPLTADRALTLQALSLRYGDIWRISYTSGRWLASRRDGTGSTLRGLTPDDLAAAMRASR